MGTIPKKHPSKNRRMPLSAASTRYSLVKGERIVRSVLTARLREFKRGRSISFSYLVVSLLELPQHSSHGRKSRAEKNGKKIHNQNLLKEIRSLSDNRVTTPAREAQPRTILCSLSNPRGH
ncbi:hypothetical protein WN943_018583 [Citrus x changshan-huyou]